MEIENRSVDVIIPTYKRASFLDRAIDSVLAQTYRFVNVIVVDDNNQNDEYRLETEKLMLKYSSNSRVTYLKHERNMNGAAARNTGIRYSSADFIAFLDDDDFYLSTKIELQIKELCTKDETWGGCACFHVRRYKKYAYKKFSINENFLGDYCYDFLSGKTSTPSSTLLIKSEVFRSIGLFDETFRRHQDLEFLVRFYQKYKMAVSPHYAVFMQTEGFRNYPKSEIAYEIKNKFLEKYKNEIQRYTLKQQREIYKSQWFEVAVLFLRDRDLVNARRLFSNYIFVKGERSYVDYFRVLFFLIVGYFPNFRKLISILFGLTVYRRFSGNIDGRILV
ncbi:glycosyltransferase family 2 protein [Arcticibacter tournemirensis]